MAIDYTNLPGGGASLSTTAPGVQGQAIQGLDMDFFRKLAERRMAPQQPVAIKRTFRQQSNSGPAPERAISPLQNLRERAEMSALQAKMNPAPQRLISGPGIVPGMGMDVNRMNSFQRDAYLPKESGATNEGMTADEAQRVAFASRGMQRPEEKPWDPLAHGRQRG